MQRIREIADEARRRAGPDPTPEAYAVLDEVADLFLGGDEPRRLEVGEFFRTCPQVMRLSQGYVGRSALALREGRGSHQLSRGLAIAALGLCSPDFRDLHIALSDLAQSARGQGLDAKAEFERVAALADETPAGGGAKGSMRAFLGCFPAG